MESELDFTAIANIGEADTRVLADDEYDHEVMEGTITNVVTEVLGREVSDFSTEELNDAAIAYLNGAIRGFTQSIEQLKGQYKKTPKSRKK
jgi:hypothetical protein